MIIGRTGSGKTQYGLWLLSLQNVDEMPWVVIDYKRDAGIMDIPYARFVEPGYIPTSPGVYVVQPSVDAKEEMRDYTNALLDAENVGIYVDEGFMFADNSGLDAIFMQGRSKHIPVIICTQRPVLLSRFAFTQASYIQVFHVIDARDRKTIRGFAPIETDDYNLPDYHSYHYDVGRDKLSVFKPVGSMASIHARFRSKLEPEDEVSPRRAYI